MSESLFSGDPPKIAPPVVGFLRELRGQPAAHAAAPPTALLDDMTLPEPLSSMLRPPLESLSFTMANQTITDPKNHKRSFTVTTCSGRQIILLHIPALVISNAEHYDSVMSIGYILPREEGTPVRILSTDGLRIAIAYDDVPLRWKQLGFQASFVNWSRVEEFSTYDEDRQSKSLLRLLDLEGVVAPPGNGAGPATLADASEAMKIGDQDKVIEILADHSQFLDANDRKGLLERAGFEELVGSIDLSGAADHVAERVVGQLRKRKQLGRLLRWMMTQMKQIPADDREFLRGLLERYRFD